MGLTEDAHAATRRYADDVRQAIAAMTELETTAAGIADRVSDDGPLGSTADPDLTRARQQLTRARARIAAAVTAAAASPATGQAYVYRAFPPS
jgi:hypothetical protein